MIIEIAGTCQYKGCDKPATKIASGRRDYENKPQENAYDIGCFCEDHADIVADAGYPEYHTICPNCGCQFGVN